MNKKALEVQSWLSPHQQAVKIADYWSSWNNLRERQRERWREIDSYIHATSTQDLMEQSAWDHTTHIPIVAEIYEDLVAIMNDTVIPHEDWLGWRPYDRSANSTQKRTAVLSYIKNRHELNGFNSTINHLLSDFVRYGNSFVLTVPQVNADGYVGPKPLRISPYDIVFNPTATDFENSPKIIRQIMDLGQFKMFCEEQGDAIDKEVMQRVLDRRGGYAGVDSAELDKNTQYLPDGFGSVSSYFFESGMIELLWFYGDIYDQTSQELHRGRKIVVVDRTSILLDVEEHARIRHARYRPRPDNLWAQGALDNIVGMNYQVNHRENSKSDAIDRFIHPDRLFVGDVEEIWDETTGQYKYLAPENGMVRDLSPDSSVLAFNSEIDMLTLRARSAARLPLQLAGFRTPGEKTAFEVQSLNEGAFRGFINKAEQFEIELLEPMVRDEIEVGRDNLTSALQVATSDEEGFVTMMTITQEDLKSNGVLVPYGARRFKRELQQMNMLYQLSNSQLGQYIGQHINTFNLAKVVERLGGFEQFVFIDKFAAIEEQREAQQLQATAEEMTLQDLQQRQMQDEM
jgi:hypothetical protein